MGYFTISVMIKLKGFHTIMTITILLYFNYHFTLFSTLKWLMEKERKNANILTYLINIPP